MARAFYRTVISLCEEIGRARPLTDAETDALELALKREHKRSNRCWTKAEDIAVMKLHKRRKGRYDLIAAQQINRTPEAVRTRIRRLRQRGVTLPTLARNSSQQV